MNPEGSGTMNKKKICFISFLCSAVSAFSQQRPVSLDAGLVNGVKYFEDRLPKGTKLLELLDQELNFQQSSEINDRTAASIGEKWGAQTIVLGSIILRDNDFRLRIRAIAVENATIQGLFTADIVRDRYLLSLYNTNPNGPAQSSGGSSSSGSSGSSGSSSSSGRIRLPDYLQHN
jgi:hypothetical protein